MVLVGTIGKTYSLCLFSNVLPGSDKPPVASIDKSHIYLRKRVVLEKILDRIAAGSK